MASTLRFDKWENTLGVPYGTVLQVIQKFADIPYASSASSNTFYTYPNNELLLNITPKFSTSKILIMSSITVGTNGNNAGYRVTRGGSAIGVGSTQGSRLKVSGVTGYLNSGDANHYFRTVATSFLDSPNTTSQISYNIDLVAEGGTIYINRNGNYVDNAFIYNGVATSSLTAMEIAQ